MCPRLTARRSAMAALAILLACGVGVAANETKTGGSKAAPAVYKPPLRGAPKTRVSGGVRGVGGQTLLTIAPEETGLTTQSQPTLYWYVGEPTQRPIVLAIANSRTLATVIETQLPAPAKAGIHSIVLEELNVSLEPDIEYEWFVTIVMDEQQSSKDIVAGGTIERRDAPAGLHAALDAAAPAEIYGVFASSGFWYDSVEALSEQIESDPVNGDLRVRRALLMEQVGLPEPAAHDRAAPR